MVEKLKHKKNNMWFKGMEGRKKNKNKMEKKTKEENEEEGMRSCLLYTSRCV